MHDHLRRQAGVFGTITAASLADVARGLAAHGPTLASLPSLVVAVASAVGMALNVWSARKDNRRKQELHEAQLAAFRAGVVRELSSPN